VSTPETLATVQLIRHLYVDLDQSMGGPLHVQLDDGNLDDYWVGEEADRNRYDHLFDGSFERYAQAGDDVSDERKNAIRDTCEAILKALRPMSVEQRHATVDLFRRGWRMRQSGIRWVPDDNPEEAS
jgi:hypothetical protein